MSTHTFRSGAPGTESDGRPESGVDRARAAVSTPAREFWGGRGTQQLPGGARTRGRLGALLFGTMCVVLSFALGVQRANEEDFIEPTRAQGGGTTSLVVTLQYLPRGQGQKPRPLTFTNVTQTKPVKLIEVHDPTLILPVVASDGCQRASEAGRCTIRNVEVGGDPERQYDIVLGGAAFFEALTGIPFQDPLPSIRFDRSKCQPGAVTGDTWCLSKNAAGEYLSEYAVTLTLVERDVCLETPPPAPQCDPGGGLVTYECDPRFTGATSPWKPKTPQLSEKFVECPDGNQLREKCAVVDGVAMFSQAATCQGHQLCEVLQFPSNITFTAGQDTVVFSGRRFGTQGGRVSFPRAGGGRDAPREVVTIPAGSNWTDTVIRVPIPLVAAEGPLRIAPEGYGAQRTGPSIATDAFCTTPSLQLIRFDQQPSIGPLYIPGSGNAPMAPGFSTLLHFLARHAEGVNRIKSVELELLDGSFPDVGNLPLNRNTLAKSTCDIEKQKPKQFSATPGMSPADWLFKCEFPIPQELSAHPGPFTFLVRLFALSKVCDGEGKCEDVLVETEAVLPVAGRAALAGDFNADGLLTIEDLVLAFRIATGVRAPTAADLLHDINGDHVLTRSDAIALLHFLAQR